MKYLNRSGEASTYTFSQAEAPMKILRPAVILQKCFMIKVSGMNLTSGEQNGLMTGIPGGRCCHITWEAGFKRMVFQEGINSSNNLVNSLLRIMVAPKVSRYSV